VQEDSSYRFTEVSPLEQLPQKLVFRFEWLSLLTKEGYRQETRDAYADEQLLTGRDNMSEGISEDMQLMRVPVDLKDDLRFNTI